MPKRLTSSKEKLLNSLVDGFTTSKASIYDKEQLFNLSRFIVTNNNFWFTFYVDATEGRVTITHEINTSYQWSDRKNIRKLCEIFNEKNDQYLIEKLMQGFEGRIGNDVYFTLVLATKLLTKIIFPHIKKIVGEKEEK